MGINSGDIAGQISDENQALITEALLKSLARGDGVRYEAPPDDESVEESTRPSRVEVGG